MAATITGSGGYGLISAATAQTTTSGTTVDFSSIPAGVKRVTVMFNNVSSNGTSGFAVQIGAGSVTTTGYASASIAGNGGVTMRVSTTYFFAVPAITAANGSSGHVVITNITGNTWIASGIVFDTGQGTSSGSAGYCTSSGSVTLGSTLDRVRVLTSNGTDTFDAGSVNILYE